MITGLAHSGVCVQDCEAAVEFYRDVLGMTVLSPPYVMDNDAIRADWVSEDYIRCYGARPKKVKWQANSSPFQSGGHHAMVGAVCRTRTRAGAGHGM